MRQYFYGGRSDEKNKRKISVGYIQPEKLDGDTISVQLREEIETVRANIVSNATFTYTNEYGHTEKGKYLGDCCVCLVNSLDEESGIEHFLEKLGKQNNAEKSEDRRIREGLILTQRLGRLEKSVNPLKRIVTDLERFSKLD